LKLNIINDYNSKASYNINSFKKLLKKILSDYKITEAKLSIILSNRKLLNKLKQNYFNLDHFTDVIVFNLEDENKPIDGEIYISLDDVLQNSILYKESFNNEFKRVLIHGVLHLLGFEDSTIDKKKEMTILENQYITYELKNHLIENIIC
jgi:rRNA maturation RNase YbeY